MFDQVPTAAWLLIGIAALAFAPASYVFRHMAHAPSRRDITLPPEDLTWRTSPQLARSLGILVALTGLAVSIVTPAAAQFARSPTFWPILVAATGAWSLSTVPTGFNSGRVQPFIRGLDYTFERQAQPGRFWTSLLWNGVLGSLCIWLAFFSYEQASTQTLRDLCSNEQTKFSRQEALAACNKLISKQENSAGSRADSIAARGVAHYHLGDYGSAISDYNEAIRLDPDQSHVFYNRGLVYQQSGDLRRASSDFSAAIRLKPTDAEAYFMRGLVLFDAGRFSEAIADFTTANEFSPRDPWPLANRGLAYAWTNERERAEADFSSVRTLDPSDPVMLRGEAVLRMNAGDLKGAVDRLTASMVREPDNEWALRTRVELYWDLGEIEKSREDDSRWLELRDRARRRRD